MFELGTEEYLRHGIEMTPKQQDPKKQAKKIQKAESDGKPDKQGMYGQDESVDVYEKQTPGQNKKANYDSFKKIYKASKKNSVPKKSSMKEGMKYSDYKKINEGALGELAQVVSAATPFLLGLGGLAGVLGFLGYKLIGAASSKMKKTYQNIVKSLRDDSKNKLVSIQETIRNFKASKEDIISKQTRKNASTKLKDYYSKYYAIKRVQAISSRIDMIITEGTNEFIGGLLAEKTQTGKQMIQSDQKGGAKTANQQESTTHEGTLLLEQELSKEQQKQMAEEGAKIKVDPKLALGHFLKIYPKTQDFKTKISKAMKEFPLDGFKSLMSSSELDIKEETYIDHLIAEKIEESKSLFLLEKKRKRNRNRKNNQQQPTAEEPKQQEVKEVSADNEVLSQVSKTDGDYYTAMYQARVQSVFEGFPPITLDKFVKTLIQKMNSTKEGFVLQETKKLNTKYDDGTIKEILNTNVFALSDTQITDIFSALYGSENAKEKYAEDFQRFSECLKGGTCKLEPGDNKEKKAKTSKEQEEKAKQIVKEMKEVQDKAKEVWDDENLSDDEKQKKIATLVKQQNDLKKLLELNQQMSKIEDDEEKQNWLSNLVGDETFSHLRGTAVENVVRKIVSGIPYIGNTLSEILTPLLALPGSGGAGGSALR